MQQDDEDAALWDMGGVPEFYADGLGDVTFMSDNARLVFFAWRKVNGVMRRCIAAEIVRPVPTLTLGVAEKWRAKFGGKEVPRVVN